MEELSAYAVYQKYEAKKNKGKQKKRQQTKQVAQQARKKLKISLNGTASTESEGKSSVERVEVKRPKEKEKKKVALETTVISAPKSILKIRKCDSQDLNDNSVENGRTFFNWLIKPIEEQNFLKTNWEERPVHIARHCPEYYKSLLSCEQIDQAIREKMFYFGKNVDVTSYVNGVRETHNLPGRANAPILWDYYNNGCSIRILNPQTFFKKIHCLNASLQEYFGCFVGANIYLTPSGSQGFAPHYDDIEAFVLQVEGRKHWKVYAPRSNEEVLPRESSRNFNEDDLESPIMEVTLEAGDLLYFPRGFIHQAYADKDAHSLHITLSVYQKNSWADFLEKLLPATLKVAVENDPAFRKGLPLQFHHHLGLVHSEDFSQERSSFVTQLQGLLTKMLTYAPVDAAVDQVAKQFQIDALPPHIREDERSRTVFGDGERIRGGRVANSAQIGQDTKIKLIRYNALRMVQEEGSLRIYYSVNNSREYHGEEPQILEIAENFGPVIEVLVKSYPNYISISELPLDEEIERIQIASDLWEVGLVKTLEPLGEDDP